MVSTAGLHCWTEIKEYVIILSPFLTNILFELEYCQCVNSVFSVQFILKLILNTLTAMSDAGDRSLAEDLPFKVFFRQLMF